MEKKRYIRKEEWKPVELPALFAEKFSLFISNLGQAKKTRLPNPKKVVVKQAFTEGYPSANLSLIVPMEEKDNQAFIATRKEMDAMKKEIKILEDQWQICDKRKPESEEISKNITLLQSNLTKKRARYDTKYHKNLTRRRRTFGFLMHRLVATAFCEKPSEEHNFVAHLDYNKLNNESTNLKWMTTEELKLHRKENPYVKASVARQSLKPLITNAKLTVKQVMIIKKRINEGVSLRTLAKRHAVTETQLLRIKRGENWGKVPAAL